MRVALMSLLMMPFAVGCGGGDDKADTDRNLSELPEPTADADADEGFSGTTHTVATKLSNACGLFDMTGNVLEWTQDWYDFGSYSSNPVTDPVGASPSFDEEGHIDTFRVSRGGSWLLLPRSARVSFRYEGGLEYFVKAKASAGSDKRLISLHSGSNSLPHRVRTSSP